jgi:hypothetical protein
MGFPIPKIVFNPGSGPVTLQFTWPPIAKPGAEEREAIRHDSDTISGYRQSVTEHVNLFLALQMDNVPQADLTAWQAFIDYAILGGSFDYYFDPVGSPSSLVTYTLDDTDWKPQFAYRTMAKFSIKMRRVGASS